MESQKKLEEELKKLETSVKEECLSEDDLLREEFFIWYEHDSQSQKKHEPKVELNYVCDICGKGVKTKATLARHLKTHQICHLECKICNIMFNSKQDLKMHKKSHQKSLYKKRDTVEYQCDICKKFIKRRLLLLRHMRDIHVVAQTHPCSKCKRIFKNKAGLNFHYRTMHLGLKKHQCDNCGLAYDTPSRLKRHQEMVHMKLKPFQCPKCNKGKG